MNLKVLFSIITLSLSTSLTAQETVKAYTDIEAYRNGYTDYAPNVRLKQRVHGYEFSSTDLNTQEDLTKTYWAVSYHDTLYLNVFKIMGARLYGKSYFRSSEFIYFRATQYQPDYNIIDNGPASNTVSAATTTGIVTGAVSGGIIGGAVGGVVGGAITNARNKKSGTRGSKLDYLLILPTKQYVALNNRIMKELLITYPELLTQYEQEQTPEAYFTYIEYLDKLSKARNNQPQ